MGKASHTTQEYDALIRRSVIITIKLNAYCADRVQIGADVIKLMRRDGNL